MEADLRRCFVTFEPKEVPRSGHMIFQPPDGANNAAEWSLARAIPVLCGEQAGDAHASVLFWHTAARTAVRLVSQRQIEPHVASDGSVTWRLSASDELAEVVRELESEAPPQVAHVREFLDGVADYLATPDMDAGVAISLRIDLPHGIEKLDDGASSGHFAAIVQVHSLTDPSTMVDAAELWDRTDRFGSGARADAMLALRKASGAWPPLRRLLQRKVPDELPLDDDELGDLLAGATEELAGMGVAVHWPEQLADRPAVAAVIPTSGPLSSARKPKADDVSFDSTELLHMSWRVTLDGTELTQAEREELARSHRPFVRLRDRWVLVDPRLARKAGETELKPLGALDALGAALTGTTQIDGERVAVTPTGWLDKLRERIADPEAEHERIDVPSGLSATLRDYQLRGLRWLQRMTSLGLGACLADDMGLGKTVTVIALHLHRQTDPSTAGRTLVVCPASLMGNWEREIERFAPGVPVRRFHGAARELGTVLDETGGGFVITTYGTMRVDTEDDAGSLASALWSMLVADEAQHVKNARSKTARALRAIPSDARVALTGTPVENNLSELWAILDWTTPGLLGARGGFRARWADPIEAGREPAATEAARSLSRLAGPFLLRRRKSDPGIAPELPAKTETDHPVSLTREQAGLYEAVVREAMATITSSDGMARRGRVLALLTALKQICNHPAQYLKEPLGPAGRSGKLELLDELVSALRAEGEAALVFTQYVSMARLIDEHFHARGVPVQLLHGGTPVDQREEMVRRFQESPPGQAPLFVLSLKAAGTGLNLTRAGHVIHYDRWWNPAVEEQATDRAYRIGQTQPVQVHRLIAEGTVEDRVAVMLERKRELADAVLDSGEAALSELSDAELAELVELRSSHG